MSGQNPAQRDSPSGYHAHRRRSSGALASDFRSKGAERRPGPSLRDATPRPSGRVTIGAAQQRWPEYNRIVILGTSAVITGLAVAAAVVEAVNR